MMRASERWRLYLFVGAVFTILGAVTLTTAHRIQWLGGVQLVCGLFILVCAVLIYRRSRRPF